VDEESFNSILRRHLVVHYRGRFVDARVLANIPDAARKGIFLNQGSYRQGVRTQ
jgi:hypothetical protein